MTSAYSTTPGGSDLDASQGYSNITVLDQPAVPCVVVQAKNVPMPQLGEIFDPVFSRLPGLIAEAGLEITAPALAIYYRIGGTDPATSTADFAAGFPVSAPLTDTLDLGVDALGEPLKATGAELPAGRIGALTHRGPYNTLPETWQKLLAGLAGRGLSPISPFWEVYVTQPGPPSDPSSMRTDLFVQLENLPSRG